jgi:hypothetical protein
VVLSIIITVFIALGLLLIIGIPLRQLTGDITQLARKPPTMRQIVEQTTNTGGSFVSHLFSQLRSTLQLTGNGASYNRYCRICVILATSFAAAALFFGNPFLAPVAALIGLFTPILYLNIAGTGRIRQESREIQVALSIITSSYKRTHSLLKSVDENIEHIHEPVYSVFKKFQGQNQFITSHVEQSLMDMKGNINNDVWREWIEAMILCQHDRSKIDMLDPIVNKLRNMDTVQMALDAMLYKPVKDFATMIFIALGIFPVIYFINHAWFSILVGTLYGKLAITVTFIALLFSLNAVKNSVRPLEYKR